MSALSVLRSVCTLVGLLTLGLLLGLAALSMLLASGGSRTRRQNIVETRHGPIRVDWAGGRQ